MSLKLFASTKQTLTPATKVGRKAKKVPVLPPAFRIHEVRSDPRSNTLTVEYSKGASTNRYIISFPKSTSLLARTRAANRYIRQSALRNEQLIQQILNPESW